MGLDMYLECDIYIGGHFEYKRVSGELSLSTLSHPSGRKPMELVISATEIERVTLHVGYWRKVNAIHGWFVDNVQDGKDECQRSPVSIEQIEDLKRICAEAVKEADPRLLPGRTGCFFGDTSVDEWYWKGIEHTVDVCDKALAMYKKIGQFYPEFYYQASW